MKRFLALFAVLGVMVALVGAASAQEEAETGSGGPVILGAFGGDPSNLNPILFSDGTSGDVVARMFMGFLGINPQTGTIEPNVPDSLVTGWEVSEEGTVYTFTLRDDVTWTDGTPVTSADVKFTYDALASGELDSPRLEDFPGVVSVEAPDPQTVVITYEALDCTALTQAITFTPLPAHYFEAEIGDDYAAMNEHPYNLAPSVTNGDFTFENLTPDEQTLLFASEIYPDSAAGAVIPRGWVLRQLANRTLVADQFLDGQLTVVESVSAERTQEFLDLAAAGDVQSREALSSGWQFMGFNLADPNNPVDGLDEDGNVIEQDPHPILGDVRVRQAFAHAVNLEELNEGAFANTYLPQVSPILQTSWAHNDDLQPYAFDQEMASALLEEAGWIDDDGDPATPRVAQGVPTVEDGTTLTFTLTTFPGNESVENSALLMQRQVGEVGMEMEIEIIEFQTMLEKLDNQTYDTIMLFFGNIDPNDPDGIVRGLFDPGADVVGSGFNSWSYVNPELFELLDEARFFDGCSQEDRKPLYDEVQRILHEDLPLYFVGTREVLSVVQPNVGNFETTQFPGGLTFNLPSWDIELSN